MTEKVPRPPVVFLVDDDPQVLKALGRMLREHGLASQQFHSAEDFLARNDPAVPGCLVLDVGLPGLSGLELQRQLSLLGCRWPIVFLTGNGDIPSSVMAMKAGAVDFLTKPVSSQCLLAAVREGLARAVAPAPPALCVPPVSDIGRRIASLTTREREVLERLMQGKRNKQIACELGIVEPTVKFHRTRIMERVGARTLAQLMHLTAHLATPALEAPAEERPDYPKG